MLVLLAYYSATYPTRQSCQWELTAALLAAQDGSDDSRHGRILVVNPEPGMAHIHPIELRDTKLRPAPAPGDAAALTALASSIAAHVGQLEGAFGELGHLSPPHWIAREHSGFSRFVDRLVDLWRLHSALRAPVFAPVTGAAGPAIVQICGLGGIGKSLLAVEYALRFGGAYPGGLFWLQAVGDRPTGPRDAEGQEATLRGELRTIAERLGLTVSDDVALEELRGVIAHAVERRGKACLWVVDDLPVGLNESAVSRWLAPHPLAATLITTRSTEYQALIRHLELGVLPSTEGYQLLTTHRQPAGPAEQEAARELVSDLGGHALAIDVAGAALRVQTGLLSFAGFRAALRDPTRDELEFASELVDELPNGHERSIAVTLLRSIRELQSEGADVLRLASVLAVAPVPSGVLAAVLRRVDELDERAGRERAARGLHQVTVRSLASMTDDAEGSWEVHALVSRTVRFAERVSSGRRDALQAAAVEVLETALVQFIGDPRMHHLARDLLAHARELVNRLAIQDSVELNLLGTVARYDAIGGAYRSAESLYRRQVHAARRLLGSDHPTTLSLQRTLAQVLRAVGALHDAKALLEEVVAGFEALRDINRSDLGSALNDLGLVLRELGHSAGAEAKFERALGIYRFVYGPEHFEVAAVLNNLGMVQRDFGRLRAAAATYQQALDIKERFYDEHAVELATTLNNLALVREDLGELSTARELIERALQIEEDAYGADHPEVAATLSNLATILQKLDNKADARRHLERALEIKRAAFGPDHPEVAFALGKLAGLEQSVGELGAARTHFERALALLEGTDQSDGLGAAQLVGSFADLLQTIGELDTARTRYEQALTIRSRIQRLDDRGAAILLGNLGVVLHRLGDLPAAKAQFERALGVLGQERERVSTRERLTELINLGSVLFDIGVMSEARTASEQALALFETLPDNERDPQTGMLVLTNHATTLRALGEQAKARATLEHAVALHNQIEAPDPFQTARLFSSLGQTLRVLGEVVPAASALRRTLDAYATARRVSQTEIAATRYELGLALFASGDLAGARDQLEFALSIEETMYGEDDPTVAWTRFHLGTVLRLLGDLPRANAILQQALRAREQAHGPQSREVFLVLCELATVHYDARDLESLRRVCERAVALLPSVQPVEPRRAAELYLGLGVACHGLRDLAQAQHAYERLLDLEKATPALDPLRLASVHNNLGALLHDIGKPHGALQEFRTAERLMAQVYGSDHPQLARLQFHIARLQGTD